MVLAQSQGAALIKGFADIKQRGRNSRFRSKVGVIREVASNTGFTVVVNKTCLWLFYVSQF